MILPTTNGNPLSDYINGNFIDVSVHKYVLYIHRYIICVYMNKCACVYICTVRTYIDTCTLYIHTKTHVCVCSMKMCSRPHVHRGRDEGVQGHWSGGKGVRVCCDM